MRIRNDDCGSRRHIVNSLQLSPALRKWQSAVRVALARRGHTRYWALYMRAEADWTAMVANHALPGALVTAEEVALAVRISVPREDVMSAQASLCLQSVCGLHAANGTCRRTALLITVSGT